MTTATLDAQRQSVAKQQSVYREVNERIANLAADETSAAFVCECSQDDCNERVPLTLEEYEHIRSRPNQFVVCDGHQLSDVVDMVETNDRYFVVETLGAGAEIAEALDPRNRRA
jgi:hypothetical protein